MFLQISTMERRLNEVSKTSKLENRDWSGTAIHPMKVANSANRMPEPLIRAGGILKQAAAIVNAEVSPCLFLTDLVRSRP